MLSILQLKSIFWEQIGQWDSSYMMGWLCQESTKKEIMQSLGFKLWFKNFLIVRSPGIDTYYLDKKDIENFQKYFHAATVQTGGRFLKKFRDAILKTADRLIDVGISLSGRRFDKLLNKELAREFNKFISLVKKDIALGYAVIPIDDVLEEFIYQAILKRGEVIRNLSREVLVAKLTPPKGKAFMIQEEEDLLKIAIAIKQNSVDYKIFIQNKPREIISKLKKINSKLLNKIKKHQESFAWMRLNSWKGTSFSVYFYIKRIQSILSDDPAKKLEEIQQKRRHTEKEIILLFALIKDKGIATTIDIIRDFIDAKMRNWDAVAISGFRVRPMFNEISRRLNISLNDFYDFSPDEIIRALRDKKPLPKIKIKDREKRRILLKFRDKIYDFSGHGATTLRQQFALNTFQKRVKIIKGQVAFPGKVKGKARIVMNIGETGKIKKGDVLVCPMTNPDYMHAIHKAVAIITDEGGILCHAAIVSRELKIPCIIGTKFATKVLKDGDLVDVDADKGIVKVVRKVK